MAPSLWFDGKLVQSGITAEGSLQYVCPFCNGACELDPWFFKVDGRDVRTLRRVACCYPKCSEVFEIARNHFILQESIDQIVQPYNRQAIYKVWKGYNERHRKRPD